MHYLLMFFARGGTPISINDYGHSWRWKAAQIENETLGFTERIRVHTGETATSVAVFNCEDARIKDGPVSTDIDGLSEFFVVEAGDLDSALDTAVALLASRDGVIEIRPIISEPMVHGH